MSRDKNVPPIGVWFFSGKRPDLFSFTFIDLPIGGVFQPRLKRQDKNVLPIGEIIDKNVPPNGWNIGKDTIMKKKVPYCDFATKNKKSVINKTRLYKHKGNFIWQGVKTEKYKTDGGDWAKIIRKVLIGNHNEPTKFHLRYFEIAPGGYSSFEKHKHEHVVIGIRGKGKVLCNTKNYQLNFLDTLYIAPDTPHQLSNPFQNPFGFLCIVNARRDKPRIITPP